MHRPPKRARTVRPESFDDVLHMGSISTSGLAKLTTSLNISDTAGERMRALPRDANSSNFGAVQHVTHLPTVDGTPFDLDIADPCVLMTALITASPTIREIYADAARRSQPSTILGTWWVVSTSLPLAIS